MFKIPKGYDTVSKTFRLPEKLIEEMERVAQNNNISLNRLVKECLIYAMENLEKPTNQTENDKNG